MPAVTTYANNAKPGNAYVDGVLGDLKWAVSEFTFSFPASGSYYGSGYGGGEPTDNFGVLNATQQAASRAVFHGFASVANLTFNEITETSTQHADLRLAMSDTPNTAWAYLPHPSAEGGDAWFNNSSGYYANPVKGNYAYTTFLHETGHALGLEHTHEAYVMPLDRDSMEYSLMSYRSYVGASLGGGYTNETWGYAQSLMMYDIAGLQHMYGANFNTNSGNTTYSWSPTTGEMFVNGIGQGAAGGNRIFQTVWDGGGNDTYDFSNYTTNLKVDLLPGEWTTTSSEQLANLHYDGSKVAVGNIANALLHNNDARSLIENAKGGSGNDMTIGNAAANSLWGNAGHDRLYGHEGDDKLYGGDGHDMLFGGLGADHHDGGPGLDYALYNDQNHAGLTASLLDSSINTGAAAGDTYVGIEGLILTENSDVGHGDNGSNWLYGMQGSDRLYGHEGDDKLHGGDGHDMLYGGDGHDMLFGGLGADPHDGGPGLDYARYNDQNHAGLTASLLNSSINTGAAAGDTYVDIEGVILTENSDVGHGDNGSNWLYGMQGNDRLYGHEGDDKLYGGDGHDMLFGGLGADHHDGGPGLDYARYDDANYDSFRVSLAFPWLNTGVAAGDTFVNIEGLVLGSGNDTAYGDSDDNWIYGLGGSDTLYGREGRDHLFGGSEVGVRDTFVFDVAATYANSDVIYDFESGVDKIALSNSIYGENPTIDFDSGSSYLFWNGMTNDSSNDDVLIANLVGVTSFDAGDYYFY